MSLLTLGGTSGATAASVTFGQPALFNGVNYLNPTSDMYVKDLWFWMGGVSGSVSVIGALYNTGGGRIGGTTQTNGIANTVFFQGAAYNLNSSNNNGNGNSPLLFVSGATPVMVGFWANAIVTIGGDGSAGHYQEQDAASMPGNILGTNNDTYGQIGNPAYYLRYYNKCTITSVPATAQHIGSVFQITGNSFQAGVQAVSLHGTAVTTYTIDSDTQMSLTVPSGATTGTVSVTSNAGGVITSAGVVTVSTGGNVKASGVVNVVKGVWFKSGGVLQPVKGVWYHSGGVINPIK